jgi:uncharacterized protein (DUF58 family)
VRTFHDEREPRHVLVADFRPSMLFGTRRAFRSVAAAEALVLLGWRLAPMGVRIGGVALTAAGPRELRGGLGERAVGELIAGLCAAHEEALAEAGADDPPLDRALEACLPALPPRGTVTLATAAGGPGPGLGAVLAGLSRRCLLRVVRVRDPFETAPPRGVYPYAAGAARRIAVVRGAGGPESVDPLAGAAATTVTISTADEPGAMLAVLGSLDDDRRR